MYCVGMTGPIASGKSTATTLFAELGVSIIDADLIAKQLTAKDQPALTTIIAHFGRNFLNSSGELDRRLLRAHIFKYPRDRLWLEQLLHPLIRQAIELQLTRLPQLYYMIEIPLLTNKRHYPYLNRILLVLADSSLQTQRAMQRDQLPRDQVNAIIKTQASAESYRALADDILVNNQSIWDLKQAILSLHQRYSKKAKESLSTSKP